MSTRKRKHTVPMGDPACLKEFFDVLTRSSVDVAPSPVHCKAFAHSPPLDITFKLHRSTHSDLGKEFSFTTHTPSTGKSFSGKMKMRDAYRFTVCNEKEVLKEMKKNFGGLDSRAMQGLASKVIDAKIEFECSNDTWRALEINDGNDYTYVAYPSVILVKLRFLSPLGWVCIEGELPMSFHSNELSNAIEKQSTRFKLDNKVGVNWLRFSLTSGERK